MAVIDWQTVTTDAAPVVIPQTAPVVASVMVVPHAPPNTEPLVIVTVLSHPR